MVPQDKASLLTAQSEAPMPRRSLFPLDSASIVSGLDSPKGAKDSFEETKDTVELLTILSVRRGAGWPVEWNGFLKC